MKTTITYFVHGTTTDNEQDLATGWQDGELSDIGRQQALDLGRTVAGQHFDAVISSDLQRAIESAELGFGHKYKIVHDRRLRECNYGDLTGRPAAEFKDHLEDYIDRPFPNGESYKDVERRLRSLVDTIRHDYPGKHAAFMAHQGPQLALDVILGGKTWPEAIQQDWRRRKAWQPGWVYTLEN